MFVVTEAPVIHAPITNPFTVTYRSFPKLRLTWPVLHFYTFNRALFWDCFLSNSDIYCTTLPLSLYIHGRQNWFIVQWKKKVPFFNTTCISIVLLCTIFSPTATYTLSLTHTAKTNINWFNVAISIDLMLLILLLNDLKLLFERSVKTCYSAVLLYEWTQLHRSFLVTIKHSV